MPDRLRGLWLAFAVLFGAQAAFAQEDMSSVKSTLQKNEQALKSATRSQKELAAREEALRRELAGLQQELVGIAGKLQRQEKLFSELEANLINLEDEEREMTRNLDQRRRELALMVQSMLKLGNVPPEMVIAMPGDFEDTLRTAKVLGLTSNALTAEARAINRQLTEVRALQDSIRENHRQISAQKAILEQDRSALEVKLAARGVIQEQLHSRREEQQAAVKRLSAESSTLRDLLQQLETRRKAEEDKAAALAMVPAEKPDAPRAAPSSTRKSDKPGDTFIRSKGRLALPAEGKVFTFYGDEVDEGDVSRGIRIRTRANAQVTAPYAGEVVYTGAFLDYGNMIIIRHGKDYHSLLAGFARVTAKLGQQVIAGEPLGEMGRAEKETALYMEIRERNRPIDPIPWLETQRIATR